MTAARATPATRAATPTPISQAGLPRADSVANQNMAITAGMKASTPTTRATALRLPACMSQ